MTFLRFKKWFEDKRTERARRRSRDSGNDDLSVAGNSARLSYRTRERSPEQSIVKQKDITVRVEKTKFTLDKFYAILRKKISERNPGGSHGLLRCWKNFCRIAGARGRGVTKAEFGIALANYGLPLEDDDLNIIFERTDTYGRGYIDFDNWVDEVMGRWDPTVNTHDANKSKIYRGVEYKRNRTPRSQAGGSLQAAARKDFWGD